MKSKNKKISLLLALVVGVTTIFSLKEYTNTQQETKKELKIKKVFTLPKEGLQTPDSTFEFEFIKHSFNGKEEDTEKNKLPEISKKEVKFTSNDNTDKDDKKNGKQLIKLTSDVLNGVTFNQAGQYTYTIKEKEAKSSDSNKIYTSSKAEYLVSIFVRKESNNNTYKVYDIQIKKTKEDTGNQVTNGAKTEYKPGTGDDGKDNNLVFENSFEQKAGKDSPTGNTTSEDEKKGLVISKKVQGDNENTTTHEFEFSLTVTKDLASKDNSKFSYTIVQKNGTASPKVQNLDYGTAKTFKLKAGERVVLANVLFGSNVKIEETETQGYTPTVSANTNGTSSTNLSDLKTKGVVLGDNASGNSIEFTNTKPTAVGVLIDNLPFIIIIAVGLSGILFYVKRKKDKANA